MCESEREAKVVDNLWFVFVYKSGCMCVCIVEDMVPIWDTYFLEVLAAWYFHLSSIALSHPPTLSFFD